LLDLILRLDDPTEGQVLMDGQDIRDFTQITYRRMFGVVSQETMLFNDTVANNITYPSDGVSQEQVESAAIAANAHSFITEFPEKYQTFVGEHGVRISGGERQRLAIARALVSEPQLLLFDEATSSLDSLSERRVQDAIDNLVNTRTTIVVAHRLSTITRADHIYVLDKGRIVENGNHQELVKADGLYASLFRLQAQQFGVQPAVGAASNGE
jgi:subfamily B ATP-binding cassette protein MsbA